MDDPTGASGTSRRQRCRDCDSCRSRVPATSSGVQGTFDVKSYILVLELRRSLTVTNKSLFFPTTPGPTKPPFPLGTSTGYVPYGCRRDYKTREDSLFDGKRSIHIRTPLTMSKVVRFPLLG